MLWLIVPVLTVAIGQLLLLKHYGATGLGALFRPEDLTEKLAWSLVSVWVAGALAMLLWRLVLVARYRPVASVTDAELPSVTVIVPAYNEGRQVYDTLRSVAASDYPADRFQIIAVDDGSVDDTWSWIDRGARELGRVVTPVRCRQNRGKRAALYEGFSQARGSIIVTVDSDSEVTPETVRNLVSPMVRDPRVGAVAGNVRVMNDGGVFGRMLDVTFTYAFEFMRAAESMIDTVTCCPGALSAVRRSIVDEVKDEWVDQTFLGAPANIGEDRALTNMVLRRGYLVKFQSNAIVLTQVPENFSQLCRMYLRWERSNFRESLDLGSFIFSRFRESSAWGARVMFLWSGWMSLLHVVFFVPTFALILSQPALLGWVAAGLVLGAVLPASVFALSRGGLRALWAVPYAAFSFLALSWIVPYALVTLQKSGWLTRAKQTQPEELVEAQQRMAA
jgi:hyaluronan synthase